MFWKTVDPKQFIDMTAEESGLAILRWWNEANDERKHPHNICNELNQLHSIPGWPRDLTYQAEIVFMEGWAWLISAALVMDDPSQRNGWSLRTRRGQAIGKHLTETEIKAQIALSRDLLHPMLQTAPWEMFGRGFFDTAVFESSKAVEVRVRKLSALPNRWIGRDLMRQAFKPNDGPLCDTDAVKGEQESMADLFAGAIGIFKNPTSHRDEVIENANEAAEAMMTASHLMRVLDRVEYRLQQKQSSTPAGTMTGC